MTINALARPREAGFDVHYLQRETQRFLVDHKQLHKVALVINQLVRAFMTAAMMAALPYAPLSTLAVGLGASAFYWLTVEGACRFEFAMPAFVGAVTYQMSRGSVPALVNGVAFQSLQAFAATLTGAWPFCLYFIGVSVMAHRDVERIHGRI